MNEIEALLAEDTAEKKRIARDAKHKNRTGKGMVKMPSDFKSKKEIKQMNGELKIYEMRKPTSWGVFKSWPKDIQQQYLNGIALKFPKVSIKQISAMFGILATSFYRYERTSGVIVPVRKGRGKNAYDPDFDVWAGLTELAEPKPIRTEEEEETIEKLERSFDISTASVSVTGTPEEVCELLKTLSGGERRKYYITMDRIMTYSEIYPRFGGLSGGGI